jgi:hypothetical protein
MYHWGRRGWEQVRCKYTMYRWGRGGAGWYLHMYIKLTTYNTEYRIEAKLMYLKLPMYLLFCMGFERNDFDGGKSISMEGVGT